MSGLTVVPPVSDFVVAQVCCGLMFPNSKTVESMRVELFNYGVRPFDLSDSELAREIRKRRGSSTQDAA